jgi:hypothetical protein
MKTCSKAAATAGFALAAVSGTLLLGEKSKPKQTGGSASKIDLAASSLPASRGKITVAEEPQQDVARQSLVVRQHVAQHGWAVPNQDAEAWAQMSVPSIPQQRVVPSKLEGSPGEIINFDVANFPWLPPYLTNALECTAAMHDFMVTNAQAYTTSVEGLAALQENLAQWVTAWYDLCNSVAQAGHGAVIEWTGSPSLIRQLRSKVGALEVEVQVMRDPGFIDEAAQEQQKHWEVSRVLVRDIARQLWRLVSICVTYTHQNNTAENVALVPGQR